MGPLIHQMANDMDETSQEPPLSACVSALSGYYVPFLQVIAIIAIVLIFTFIIKRILFALRDRFTAQQRLWPLSFVSALYKPLSYFVWLSALLALVNIISRNFFLSTWINMPLMLHTGAIVALLWFLWRWNQDMTHRMMVKSRQQHLTLTPDRVDVLSKIIAVIIAVVGLLLLMDATGYNIQTLIAFGGIGGIALAFASQQVISNFFGGFMIYLTQPFAIGETINIPDRKIEGQVENIGWYVTKVRQSNTCPIYVPNSIFTQTIVLTPSRITHEQIQEVFGIYHPNPRAIGPLIDDIRHLLSQYSQIDLQRSLDVNLIKISGSAADIEIKTYVRANSGVHIASLKQDILIKVAELIQTHDARLATPVTTVEIPSAVAIQSLPSRS